MAINNSFSEFKDYFIYTKICPCEKDVKNSKIYLSFYDETGGCILSEDERKKFSFKCLFCKSFNQINLDEICNKYAVVMLKNLSKIRQNRENENLHELFDLKIED